MNSKKTPTRIKTFISLILSLLVVTFVTPKIFVGETTAFNPRFIAMLKNMPQSTLAYIRYPLDRETRENVIETSQIQTTEAKPDLQYNPIAAGVYAAQEPETGETIVKIDAGTELEVKTIKTDDGREIKIYVPIR